MKKRMWFSQEILGETYLFGKEYFWMKDVDNTIYLARAKPVYHESVDGNTGESTKFIVGWEPEL